MFSTNRNKSNALKDEIERQSSEHVRSVQWHHGVSQSKVKMFVLLKSQIPELILGRKRKIAVTYPAPAKSKSIKMLLLRQLITFSVAVCLFLLVISTHIISAAFSNGSQVIGLHDRSSRQRFFASEPTSPYYTNFNTFRPYWYNRPPYIGKRRAAQSPIAKVQC